MSEEKTLKGKIQFKRDSTENWIVNGDYIPANGEPCHDTSLNKLKIGDGVTAYKDLRYVNDVSKEDVEELKELIGEKPVATQISEAINAINIDEISKINSISINGTLLDIVNKNITIPIATQDVLGVVMGSDEISIDDTGAMSVNKIHVSKLVQDENETIILNNGNSFQIY